MRSGGRIYRGQVVGYIRVRDRIYRGQGVGYMEVRGKDI